MKLSKTEKYLIKDLFRASEGLYVFTLYRRYNIPPKDLFGSISKLVSNCLVEILEDRISLTQAGVEFAISKELRSSSMSNDRRILTKEEFEGPRIEINSFYIPREFSK